MATWVDFVNVCTGSMFSEMPNGHLVLAHIEIEEKNSKRPMWDEKLVWITSQTPHMFLVYGGSFK